MNSFVVGKVVEPEHREITQKKDGKKRSIIALGILSGRSCSQFEIWDGDKMFEKVARLKDGELVLAVVNPRVDEKGNIQHYLNAIGICPPDLRVQLMNLVK